MNSRMQAIVVESEGRYFSAEEHALFVRYTEGMGERVSQARAIQLAEDELLDKTQDRLLDRIGGLDVKSAEHEALLHDLRVHLRYLAAAHVRDDMEWFSVKYADWAVELGLVRHEPQLLRASYDALGASLSETLESAELAAISPYHAEFMRQLGGR
ncbi:MAG: hypothetical protein AAGF11_19870 [Myxococcota bacterium]